MGGLLRLENKRQISTARVGCITKLSDLKHIPFWRTMCKASSFHFVAFNRRAGWGCVPLKHPFNIDAAGAVCYRTEVRAKCTVQSEVGI